MAQYIHGGESRVINVKHIVSLKLQQGSIRNGSHKDDFAYDHYLVAEMMDGSVHELGYWDSGEDAWSARQKLIKGIGTKKRYLKVSSKVALPDLFSGHALDQLQMTAGQIEELLRAVEGHLSE